MIRLLLVDDQPLVRQGLAMRLALEPDILVVGAASNGEDALSLVQTCSPNIVLMDVEMPGMDGITATQMLGTSVPTSIVVMISIHDNTAVRSRAQAAGAVAFLSKDVSIEEMLSTLRKAVQKSSCDTEEIK